MLQLLGSGFLTVIFIFHFLVLVMSWTVVALITNETKLMNGYKGVLKPIWVFPIKKIRVF